AAARAKKAPKAAPATAYSANFLIGVAARRNRLRHRTARSALRPSFEEQGLADDGRDGGRLEGLGNQEGGLGAIAGEEPLRIGGDEDNRNFERLEHLVDGVEARTVVGELDVGENQS